MPRSRSRSPVPSSRRDRRRSRSRERRHRKKRSRSRSPRHRVDRVASPPPRYRSRSNSPRRRSPSPRSFPKEVIDVDSLDSEPMQDQAIEDVRSPAESNEEDDMMKLMGFGSFNSTKGKKVEGNDVSAVNLVRKRRYRQYMNRRGGFNRPLDFVA